MSNIELTIIIVNFNVKDFLFDCLKSIENSVTNFSYETIVIDNNSTDNSIEYLKPIFKDVNFLELPENLGFGKANNIGIDMAKGKYLLLLNPDTIIEPETLQVMYDYMNNNQEVDIAGCKILNPDGSFQLPCRRGFPTPWAAFSKLFGLQTLFPKSKLFAQYNQTFRPIDETYYIDAVMGAFMFCRTDKIRQVGGFDPDFFMYGEDLDLCYRIQKLDGKVAYVHSTSIIHYKGESTRRSSINEIKHFYEAMAIFVQKHYSHSKIFLMLLRLGIYLRTFVAYLLKFKREYPIIITDLIIVNLALMIATPVRFESVFGFPEYAYPLVFYVITIVQFLSLFMVGEYFEGEHSIRKVFFGYLITFFVLMGLTYFFKEFAFSRGVLLLTIGLGILMSALVRFISSSFPTNNQKSKPKIVIIANSKNLQVINEKIKSNPNIILAEILGVVTIDNYPNLVDDKFVVGNFDYFIKNIEQFQLDEIVVYGENQSQDKLSALINKSIDVRKPIYFIKDFTDYSINKVIHSVSSNQFIKTSHKLLLPRFKFAKRAMDLIFITFSAIFYLPISLIVKNNLFFQNFKKVFKGEYSLIGIYPTENIRNYNSKPGILNLVRFANKNTINETTVKKLNDYYENNYSLALDFDILIKFVFKRR